MLYEVTVEDPPVLLQPWELKPMLMSIATAAGGAGGGFGNPTLVGVERGHCQAYELDDIENQIRH